MIRTPNATPETIDLPLPVQRTARAYLGNVAATMSHAFERGRQRRALAELDEHLLRDIGLNRGVVAREVQKYFWQP